jgi:ribonuclease HI
MREGDILVYTDGACSGNPGPGGWGAVVLSPDRQVRELGGGSARTTNNRMELTAAISALECVADRPGRVSLYTDSTYLISGMTRWLPMWKRKGWTRVDGGETLNRDLWEELDRLVSGRHDGVSWFYVRGHKGHPGNSRCDAIAVAFSHGEAASLYEGPGSGYSVDLTPPEPQALPAPSSQRSPGAKKAGWYLSLLDGRLERHQTWASCQARVHGKPAQFKKVASQDEESAILKKWGLA